MVDDGAAMQAYYAQDKERDRLHRDVGRVEYARTLEVVGRTLPPAPAAVADIGGGGPRRRHLPLGCPAPRDAGVQDPPRVPAPRDSVDQMERSGRMDPIVEAGFTGFAHAPDELRDEILESGLELQSLVALEGLAFALADLDDRFDDPDERTLLMDTLRAVESVPDLLGLGPHLLASARPPPAQA